MSEHSQVVRVTTFKPADGRRSDLVALCEEMAETTRTVEGCFGVQVCSVREEPDWVAVISRWENAAGLEKTKPAIEKNRGRMQALVSEPPRVYHLTPLS